MVLVGNGRGYLAALVDRKSRAVKKRKRRSTSSMQACRITSRCGRSTGGGAFTIDSGLLTANGKAQTRRDYGALWQRDGRDVHGLRSGRERPDDEDSMSEPSIREHPVQPHKGQTISWQVVNGAIELTLIDSPCNEIGSRMLEELEKFAGALPGLESEAHAVILHSDPECGIFGGSGFARTVRSRAGIGESGGAQVCASSWSAFTP